MDDRQHRCRTNHHVRVCQTNGSVPGCVIELGYQPHDVERKVITPDRLDDMIAARLPPHIADPDQPTNVDSDMEDSHVKDVSNPYAIKNGLSELEPGQDHDVATRRAG